jgi:hypothetical protein
LIRVDRELCLGQPARMRRAAKRWRSTDGANRNEPPR